MLLPDFTNIQYGYAAVIGNLLNRYGLFKKKAGYGTTVSCLDSALPSFKGGRMGNAKFKKRKLILRLADQH